MTATRSSEDNATLFSDEGSKALILSKESAAEVGLSLHAMGRKDFLAEGQRQRQRGGGLVAYRLGQTSCEGHF